MDENAAHGGLRSRNYHHRSTDYRLATGRCPHPGLGGTRRSAIGLSLYNFLNILNINQIWIYGRSCAFGKSWLNTLVQQTGFNPFDHGDNPQARSTRIGFGTLSRSQQLMGIGYLYVESQLNAL